MMSRQFFKHEIPSTEAIDLDEVDPLPQQEEFALLNYGSSIYDNYLQAINRLYIDIQTANIFPAFLSKQDKFTTQDIIGFPRRTEPTILDPQELYSLIDSWRFTIRDKNRVIYYILEYPELVPIINQAYLIISGYFKNPSLVLEVRKDPEEGSEILVLYIQTSLSAEKAYTKLDQIDEHWWLEVSKEIGDLLCLHVEFQ